MALIHTGTPNRESNIVFEFELSYVQGYCLLVVHGGLRHACVKICRSSKTCLQAFLHAYFEQLQFANCNFLMHALIFAPPRLNPAPGLYLCFDVDDDTLPNSPYVKAKQKIHPGKSPFVTKTCCEKVTHIQFALAVTNDAGWRRRRRHIPLPLPKISHEFSVECRISRVGKHGAFFRERCGNPGKHYCPPLSPRSLKSPT